MTRVCSGTCGPQMSHLCVTAPFLFSSIFAISSMFSVFIRMGSTAEIKTSVAVAWKTEFLPVLCNSADKQARANGTAPGAATQIPCLLLIVLPALTPGFHFLLQKHSSTLMVTSAFLRVGRGHKGVESTEVAKSYLSGQNLHSWPQMTARKGEESVSPSLI